MRFYEIQLDQVVQGSAVPVKPVAWTSFPGEQYDPKALDIEFDVTLQAMSLMTGAAAHVRVMGVEFERLRDAWTFTTTASGLPFWQLSLSAGLIGGLPLSGFQSKSGPPGKILVGQVASSFGNWTGTEMELDFVVAAEPAVDDGANLTFDWEKDIPFSEAIETSLERAYPGFKIQLKLSNGDQKSPVPRKNTYRNLQALAYQVNRWNGVEIYRLANRIVVTDRKAASKAIPLDYQDLIGQPTFTGTPFHMTIKTSLRTDIFPTDRVTLPREFTTEPGLITAIPALEKYTQRNRITFKGTFLVVAVRHIGHFRGTAPFDWITILETLYESNE